MIKTILPLTIFIYVVQAASFAQGAWNINYIPTRSIDSTFIGKEVRLDFKRNSSDTLSGPVKSIGIRNLLSTKDTVKLEIGKDSMRFVEVWKIHVDHGVVSEQFLQCLEEGQSEVWIRELYLKSVTRLFFTFDAVIFRERSQEKRQIWIPKAKVKGVLVAVGK